MEEFNRLRTKAAPPVPPALPKTIKPSQGRSVTAIEAGIPDRPTITPDLTTAACRRRTQVWYFRYNHISDKAIDCILSADMDRQSSAYQQAVKMVKEHATDLQTKTVGSQGSGWFVKHIESVVAEHDFRVHLNNIRRNQRFYEVISLGPESDVARRDREEKVFSAQVFYEEHKMRWADSIRNAISTTEESLAIESRTSTGSSKMQELIAERNRHKGE